MFWKNKQTESQGFSDIKFAERYLLHTETDVLHEKFERTQMLKLIGNIDNKKILIAGSGPGIYTKKLQLKSKEVVSLDKSEAMNSITRRIASNTSNVITHDLEDLLPFKDKSFDLIISPLTLQYVKDWNRLFKDVFRILTSGGKFIFSTINPIVTQNKDSVYHDIEEFRQYFAEFNATLSAYRRPIKKFFEPIIEAGFEIAGIHEPLPDEEIEAIDKNIFQSLSSNALFIFFDLKKRS